LTTLTLIVLALIAAGLVLRAALAGYRRISQPDIGSSA
jgi:hypothetical protein